MELKETLQLYRKRQGLSQIELAEALDVSRQTISKWETGTALPAAEHLLALSKLYGVPVDALLNGVDVEPMKVEDVPELVPLLTDTSLPPEPERALSRRRLVLRILAVLLPCDLLLFFMDISWYSNGGLAGFLSFAMVLRILLCCAIGLFFAWQDRLQPMSKKRSLLIAAAALVIGLYPILLSAPILWRLYDLIAWSNRISIDTVFPTNPVRAFIAWTLCDEYAFFSHMLLVTCFQLGRLKFSSKKYSVSQPQAVQRA